MWTRDKVIYQKKKKRGILVFIVQFKKCIYVTVYFDV